MRLQVRPGDVVLYAGGVQSFTQITTSPEFPGLVSSATAAYNNTLKYYARPVTPGLTIASVSGRDYLRPAVTAAPEPGPLALLGLGGITLTGAGLARRRKAGGA